MENLKPKYRFKVKIVSYKDAEKVLQKLTRKGYEIMSTKPLEEEGVLSLLIIGRKPSPEKSSKLPNTETASV